MAEELTEVQRMALEQFGILKTPKPPKVDALIKEIVKRKGEVTLKVSVDGASANVALSGKGFDALSDDPCFAVSDALTQALLAEPQQISFFEGRPDLDDETTARLRELKAKAEAQRQAEQQRAEDAPSHEEGSTDDDPDF